MIWVLLTFVALLSTTLGFECLQYCRVPYFACVNKGISGSDIPGLQRCVAGDVKQGKYDQSLPDCVTCVNAVMLVSTDFPSASPTAAPIQTARPTGDADETKFCKEFARKRLCNGNSQNKCTWDDREGTCVPGQTSKEDDAFASLQEGIGAMRPCLSDCRDFALVCAFERNVMQNCSDCMRACTHFVAGEADRSDESSGAFKCYSCMNDLYEVISDPTNVPKDGFTAFKEYKKWLTIKPDTKSCKSAGGKWKRIKGDRTQCLLNKEKKLRCGRVTDLAACSAIGCGEKGKKKKKCRGKHKWL